MVYNNMMRIFYIFLHILAYFIHILAYFRIFYKMKIMLYIMIDVSYELVFNRKKLKKIENRKIYKN